MLGIPCLVRSKQGFLFSYKCLPLTVGIIYHYVSCNCLECEYIVCSPFVFYLPFSIWRCLAFVDVFFVCFRLLCNMFCFMLSVSVLLVISTYVIRGIVFVCSKYKLLPCQKVWIGVPIKDVWVGTNAGTFCYCGMGSYRAYSCHVFDSICKQWFFFLFLFSVLASMTLRKSVYWSRTGIVGILLMLQNKQHRKRKKKGNQIIFS